MFLGLCFWFYIVLLRSTLSFTGGVTLCLQPMRRLLLALLQVTAMPASTSLSPAIATGDVDMMEPQSSSSQSWGNTDLPLYTQVFTLLPPPLPTAILSNFLLIFRSPPSHLVPVPSASYHPLPRPPSFRASSCLSRLSLSRTCTRSKTSRRSLV